MNKILHSTLITYFLIASAIGYSQNKQSTFNASFWDAYADKLQLNAKDRQEFITAHKRLHSTTPLLLPQPSHTYKQGYSNILAPPCINADFELGSITGWTATSGFNPGFNPLGCCPNPGGQQTIMTGAGTDPYGGFPVVLPGGNFSLRLGNDLVNGEADRIEQTFLVSASNANFSYQYAVVLEDPNHPLNQQPFFQVEMLDTTGAVVPCTNYYVAAGQNIPGFFNSPISGVIYKPWTTVLVDLTPYIGQNITIRFSTYDCSLGGHFGYAYIDGVCQAFTGGGSATICATSTHTFCAPTGLASYTWNGPGVVNSVGQCVTASAPGVYTVQTTLFTNCNGPDFTYTLNTQGQNTATAGPPTTVCANNSTVNLTGNVGSFSSTGQWSTSGSGAFGFSTSLNTTYIPSVADIASGLVTLTLTSTNNGVCPAGSGITTISITPAPIVNAGTGQTICSSGFVALNGNVSAATTTGSWTSSGSGTFTPSAAALNATYTPSAADATAGSVTLSLTSSNNGNCIAVTDTVIITIRKPAVVTAGFNQSICSNAGSIALNGNVSGSSSTGIWTSSGTGGFTPNNTNLSPNYAITPADIISGIVTITLTSTNNGPCPAVSDTAMMTISTLATVNSGSNQNLCSNTSLINLNGTVSGVSNSGVWTSSGSGIYIPNNTTLVTDYSITPADISNGSVTFTLTSGNNGPCPAVSDTVKINIIQLATVTAGPNQSLCSNTGNILLNGNVTGGTSTGLWTSSGTGGFIPANTTLNASYGMTTADITAGTVTFTLSSTNNGPCPIVNDTVQVSITTLASVNAGPNQNICSNSPLVNLTGTLTGASGVGIWTSSGSGSYTPSNTSFVTDYNITPADIAAGGVTFTLTSTNNGPCPAVTDSVKINIHQLAAVNAGPDKSICSNAGTVSVSGTINGVTNTGIWSTSGSGAFVPSPTTLNNTYFITTGDISSGFATYTLTSTNNGACPAVTDTMRISITQLASSNAGPNQMICSNAGTITLGGFVSGGTTTGIWTTNGTGTFAPSSTTLNTNYLITPADIAIGAVNFTLTSTNNGACSAVTDSVKIGIRKLAIVNAGPDQSICSNNTNAAFNGTVTGSTTSGIWSTSGAGSFSPNNTSLSTSYFTNTADVSAGSVLLILTSTNNGVCPAVIDTAKLTITTKPILSMNPDTNVCAYGNQFTAAASLTGGSGNVLWTTNGNGFFSPDFANPTTYNYGTNDINSGVVILTVTSINNGACGNSSAQIFINIQPVPNANFTASTYTAYIPNDPITFNNQSTGAVSYSWNFGDGNSSTVTNPIHNYPAVGFYTVGLIAVNQYGCTDTAQQVITIISDIQFPNVFTPNTGGPNGGAYNPADLSNDVFFPYTSGVTDYHLMIFNRWGELIFDSRDINIGWDGYFNGKLCQQDAYVWKVDLEFFDKRKYNKTGSVTLLR